ncbi:hypothetical protein [Thalassospira sp.]|uniref:hypothetical protein n=1 Tax=Thalassospira sp. TaxID=1912094 RepID=UPI0032EAFD24
MIDLRDTGRGDPHGTDVDHRRGQTRCGGYRQNDILVITGYPYDPEFNVVG